MSQVELRFIHHTQDHILILRGPLQREMMVGRNHRALLEEGKKSATKVKYFCSSHFFLAERKIRSAIEKEREADDLQQLVSLQLFLICRKNCCLSAFETHLQLSIN